LEKLNEKQDTIYKKIRISRGSLDIPKILQILKIIGGDGNLANKPQKIFNFIEYVNENEDFPTIFVELIMQFWANRKNLLAEFSQFYMVIINDVILSNIRKQ